MLLRNKRSHSSQSSLSIRSNQSAYDIMESNRCELSELQKRVQEITIVLKGSAKQKENEPKQDRSRQAPLQPSDYDMCLLNVKYIGKKLKRIGSSYERAFEILQEESKKLEQTKKAELQERIHFYEEEQKFRESQHNNKVMALNQQFSRKEQAYQAVCSNFMHSTNSAYRIFSKVMGDVEQRCRQFVSELELRTEDDRKYHQFYEDIISLVEQLNLRQANNDSIEQDLSYAESSPNHRNTNKNTIEMSSIEPIEEEPSEEIMAKSKQIEQSLKLLTKVGFFNSENEGNVRDMFKMVKLSGNHNNLLQSSIYPIMLDLFKNNLKPNEEQPSVDPEIIQEESVFFQSQLSHREDNVDSVVSRHLDEQQLIQPDEESRRRL